MLLKLNGWSQPRREWHRVGRFVFGQFNHWSFPSNSKSCHQESSWSQEVHRILLAAMDFNKAIYLSIYLSIAYRKHIYRITFENFIWNYHDEYLQAANIFDICTCLWRHWLSWNAQIPRFEIEDCFQLRNALAIHIWRIIRVKWL